MALTVMKTRVEFHAAEEGAPPAKSRSGAGELGFRWARRAERNNELRHGDHPNDMQSVARKHREGGRANANGGRRQVMAMASSSPPA